MLDPADMPVSVPLLDLGKGSVPDVEGCRTDQPAPHDLVLPVPELLDQCPPARHDRRNEFVWEPLKEEAEAVGTRVMEENNLPITCRAEVEFQRVGTEIERRLEGGERVLRIVKRGAAMSNDENPAQGDPKHERVFG